MLSNAKSGLLTRERWAQNSSAVIALPAYTPRIRSTGHFSDLPPELNIQEEPFIFFTTVKNQYFWDPASEVMQRHNTDN